LIPRGIGKENGPRKRAVFVDPITQELFDSADQWIPILDVLFLRIRTRKE